MRNLRSSGLVLNDITEFGLQRNPRPEFGPLWPCFPTRRALVCVRAQRVICPVVLRAPALQTHPAPLPQAGAYPSRRKARQMHRFARARASFDALTHPDAPTRPRAHIHIGMGFTHSRIHCAHSRLHALTLPRQLRRAHLLAGLLDQPLRRRRAHSPPHPPQRLPPFSPPFSKPFPPNRPPPSCAPDSSPERVQLTYYRHNLV